MLESNVARTAHTLQTTQATAYAAQGRSAGAALRRDKIIYCAALVLIDAVALTLAFALAFWLRFTVAITVAPEIEPALNLYLPLMAALLGGWLLLFAFFRLYDFRLLLGGLAEYGRVLNACTVGVTLVIVVTFVLPDLPQIARGWLVMAWLLAVLLVCVGRFAARRVAYAGRSRGHFVAPALIVGSNQEASALLAQFANTAMSGLAVRGVVAADDDAEAAARSAGLPVLGTLAALDQIIAQQGVTELIVAPSALSEQQLLAMTQLATQHPDVTLRLSSGLYEVLTTGMQVTTMGAVPLMTVNRLRLTTGETMLKTALDYGVILLLLPLLLPLFLLLALLIKLDSRGPAFYKRRVVGVGGREFNALKFRTMVTNGDEILRQYPELQEQLQRDHKLKDDPRITRVGRMLRKVSLDELPQLINVLAGQMSLVGPRMVHPSEVEKYGRMKDNLFTVKPGLTGMWQVSGRSDLSYDERVRLDMLYIRNYSLWLDLQILFFQTPSAVLRGHGAY